MRIYASVTERRWECEAGQRHAEIIVKDLVLSGEKKGVSTPGVSEEEDEREGHEQEKVDEGRN